ncbi:hypothetical protein BMS3Bbin04_02072 [bacterium BMS3Bbin04]|nr:hypothetical protein BMS3Bbin04_02072 [bacterium BMS3Bbin04]
MNDESVIFPRSTLVYLALLLIVLIFNTSVFAQGYGRVISQPDDPENNPIRPYMFGNFGYGNPSDEAYDLAFDNPFFRFGGGFGLIFYDFGAEVMIRRGTLEETHLVAAEYGDEALRSFLLSTTEIQFRVYGRPHVGKVLFPSGVGVGLVTITVDRGYPGVFDRFSGSGLYVGPFVGAEYPINDMFSLGAEVEYAIGESSFSGSDVWIKQHSEQIDMRGGSFPVTEDGFWDTVGGNNEDFSNGGWIVSLRATILIPVYTQH